MRTRAERRVAARNTWDRLEVSFWFAPAVMSLAAVLLAWVMFWFDSQIPNPDKPEPNRDDLAF
jgi:uncharacterized membrane protein